GQDLPEPLSRIESYTRQLLDSAREIGDLGDALSLAGLPGLAIVYARAASAMRAGGPPVDKPMLDDLLYMARRQLGLEDDDPALWLLLQAGRPARRRRAEQH